ncbi:MAG: hypothetical protein Unbinned5350contig1001_46 [Prokaryotic dsDNA virus sp.]|nr:MAG: hypothetical protein Unbinned5350contig1001_46 [Prokaryotic dsDNA virus sp.]|tara:strand:- start:9283 stop:9939 length:657 start_codon:yes stop_codon:yes gene_type:complete
MAKGSRKVKELVRTVEYEGEVFEVPLTGKGKVLSTEGKMKIVKVVCFLYATDKYNLVSCLNMCGVKSDTTWYNWIDEVGEIGELYLKAQLEKDRRYRVQLKERGRTVVERMMDGYIVDLVEKREERVNTGEIDKDGKVIYGMQILSAVQKQIYIRPSPAIIKMAVFNVDRDMFKPSIKEDAVDNELMASDIKILIEGGSVPPVTDESEIGDINKNPNE